jgi:hypothetical protein
MKEMARQKHRPYNVSIGAEEHKRLKILAAELRRSMSDLMNAQINDLWNNFKSKERNTHGTEKTTVS